MMSTEDRTALEYINWYIGCMLERPHMYASNPEALEDVLMALDSVRGILVGGVKSVSDVQIVGYSAYLQSTGHSAVSACSAAMRDRSTAPDWDELFRIVVETWRQYEDSDFSTAKTRTEE